FIALELAQISDEQAAKLFSNPESARYRHHLEEARKFRPHQLSEPEERVLTDFSPVGSGAWVRLFEELCAGIRMDLDGRDLGLEAVTSRDDVCGGYYRGKRRLLGGEELHEWDRYAPVAGSERHLAWEDARELVLGSYQRFSPKVGKLIEEFFAHGWIDAPVVPNKAGGAYCMQVSPRHHPYVMLNFTGKFRDALVMAHELGHGLHDQLAAKQEHFDYQ